MAESLAELGVTVVWEAELVSNELGYLTEDICKRNIEGVIWLLFTSYGNPLQYILPGESNGQRSLVGYRPQGLRVRQD